ncbi:MAG: dihydrodipicolinate synthase family protein [Verrucomicrobiota bacterium]
MKPVFETKSATKHRGAVVPMVTPVTEAGQLDEAAVQRLVENLVEEGLSGIFVLGTTGEGAFVPEDARRRLVECAAKQINGRCLLYAGLGDLSPENFGIANDYLRAGADAVVVHPPISKPVPVAELGSWYRALLDQCQGPVVLYNMPMTTKVSIPLDAIEQLLGHPRLVGVKDSENNPARIEELLRRFGGQPDFSVFIGVGALMEKGLRLGADGIVPSVGNLVPKACENLCTFAQRKDWTGVDREFSRMSTVAALYQKGRTLNESLSVLKAAVHCRGLCGPHVLPPLLPLPAGEIAALRREMSRLQLLDGTR